MLQKMDVPVLIVGAGPSGATAALHLGRLGIKSLVVSKHKSTANTPRAHIFNQRAMEVLRDAELEPALEKIGTPADGETRRPPTRSPRRQRPIANCGLRPARNAAYVMGKYARRRGVRPSLGLGQQAVPEGRLHHRQPLRHV